MNGSTRIGLLEGPPCDRGRAAGAPRGLLPAYSPGWRYIARGCELDENDAVEVLVPEGDDLVIEFYDDEQEAPVYAVSLER